MLARIRIAAALLCALVPGRVHADAPATVTRLLGRVTEQGTRRPLAGAELVVLDDHQRELAHAVTDAAGSYALALPPDAAGELTMVLAAAEHRPARVHERLRPRERVQIDYALRRYSYAQYESTVRARPVREEIGRVTLSGEEVVRIPGVRGDLLGAVLNLPGVARSPFDEGQLIIRGAEPYESGAFLGGIAIPQPFHFGSSTSTFNSYLLERFELIPSNFSVRYGRLIGGVVDLQPRSGRSDRLHGDVKIDLLEAHVILEGPIGKGSFALALRRSYIDAFFAALVPGRVAVAPRYYDYQGLLDYPVAGGHLRLTLFGSDDALDLASNGHLDASLLGAPTQRYWFHLFTASYLRRWQHTALEATVAAGPQHIETSGGPDGSFAQDRVEVDARLELRRQVFASLKVTGGFDLQGRYQWLHVDGPPPATEDQVVPSTIPTRSSTRQGLLASPALYVQADWQILRRWALVAGVRADWFAGTAGAYAQPRLMSRIELARATYLKLGAGLFDQPPEPILLDPVLGNPRIRPAQAIHLVVGVESRPFRRAPSLSIESNAFYKDLRNLTVGSSDATVRDGRLHPLVYDDGGIGRVYGADLFVHQDSPRFVYGWISYTVSRSERLDHPGQPWRAFRFDQTHVLTLVLGYHLPWDVDVGARFRYATGNPDTALLANGHTTFDADHDAYRPQAGALFANRLPDFWQLDVRVDKRFVFRSFILSVYLDFYNVTNQTNVEGWTYSYDYARRIATTGLPIIPSLGLRGSF
jgi:outer membrane receptor protein involved in Fe transport